MQLFNKKFEQYHHLGRFLTVRRAYSFFQSHWQRLYPGVHHQNLQPSDRSMFNDIPIDACVEQIRQQGVYLGLQLPAVLVEQIYQYAKQNPCTEPDFNQTFLSDEVENGRLRGGRRVMRGLVSNLIDCQAITKIVQDPLLLQIVKKYLGYFPTHITRHLTWSFASDLSEEELKQLYPPANYHYDVAGLNFMTAYFYITDVNASSGPHVMFKYSHNQKPLYMVFASGRQPDRVVLEHYGQENEFAIEGCRGFGFIQDPSCYHKVVSPTRQNRLLLQIRYS